MAFRDIKNRARRDLHKAMQVPAYYYAQGSLVPLPVNIRVHNKWLAQGDVKGTSFAFAETREDAPALVFLYDEIDPDIGAVVMISSSEGYRVQVPDPRYLQTVTAKVTPLLPHELPDFLSPEEGMVAAGDLTIPFLTTDTNGDAAPFVRADAVVMLFYLAEGALVVPPVE
jgi:hypothetical protein